MDKRAAPSFISIIVPLFNEAAHVASCLDSLQALDYPADRREIIVVDNGSTDESAEIARRYAVTLLSLPGVRVGAVRNHGAAHARGDVLVFVDADCTVDPGWLERGLRALEGRDAVGGLVMLRERPSWIERNWILDGAANRPYQKTFVGACILVRRPAFDAIGGFDPDLNAGEDSKFTSDLLASGYAIAIDTDLNVVHLGFPTNVAEFVARQRWQASDYARNLGQLGNDPVMLLVVVAFALLLAAAASALLGDPALSAGLALAWLLLPAVLSAKRISRYGGLRRQHSLPGIYLVDLLYVVGRMLGLIDGILQLFGPRGQKSFKTRG